MWDDTFDQTVLFPSHKSDHKRRGLSQVRIKDARLTARIHSTSLPEWKRPAIEFR